MLCLQHYVSMYTYTEILEDNGILIGIHILYYAPVEDIHTYYSMYSISQGVYTVCIDAHIMCCFHRVYMFAHMLCIHYTQ